MKNTEALEKQEKIEGEVCEICGALMTNYFDEYFGLFCDSNIYKWVAKCDQWYCPNCKNIKVSNKSENNK